MRPPLRGSEVRTRVTPLEGTDVDSSAAAHTQELTADQMANFEGDAALFGVDPDDPPDVQAAEPAIGRSPGHVLDLTRGAQR